MAGSSETTVNDDDAVIDTEFSNYETTTVDPGWEFTFIIILICVVINLSLPLWLRLGDWWSSRRKLKQLHDGADEPEEVAIHSNSNENRRRRKSHNSSSKVSSRNDVPIPANSTVSGPGSTVYSKNLKEPRHHHSSSRGGPSSVVSSSVVSSAIISDVASTILNARPKRSRLPQPRRKRQHVRSPVRSHEAENNQHGLQRLDVVRMATEFATAEQALQHYSDIYGDDTKHNNIKNRDDRSDVTPSVMSKMDVDDISVQDAVDAKDAGVTAIIKAADDDDIPNEGFGWNRMLDIADWDREMRKFVALAVPFCLQGVSVEIFDIVNVAIIGHFIGVKEANAFVVVSILIEFTETLTTGFAECIGVLIPHADGAGNDLLVGRYLQLGLFFYTVMTIPGVIIWGLYMEEAVRWFGFDDETAIMGQEYAYTLLIYLFIEGIFECFSEFLNTLDHERYATFFTIIAAAVESIAIIVVGVLGIKDLVVVGLVQVAIGCIALLIDMAIIIRKGWLERYWEGLLRTNGLKDRRAMHTVFITAIPLGVAWLLTFGEWEVMTLFAREMGPAEVAAWGIIGYVWSAFETVTDGFGDAAEVRVGFRMGSGQVGIAKMVGEKSIYFGIVIAVFETGLLFILAEYLPGWLTPDPTLQKMLFDLIPLIGFGQILMVAGMEAWAVIGAQGRVRLATVIEFIVSWFIAVPLSAVFVYVFNFNLESMVAALTIAYTVGANVYLFTLFKSNWEELSSVVIARNAAEGVMYDEFDWEDLPRHIQQAASTLGYTIDLWDNDKEPESSGKDWDDLTEEEKKAAVLLGFNQTKWDADGSTSTDSGDDSYDDMDWDELPKNVKKAARTLGYTKKIWDSDGNSPLDDYDWNELSEAQQKAAELIGYNQLRWDEGSDALPSYDHLDWADLPSDVQTAAKCLKYTQSIWDNDGDSPLDKLDWNELTRKQQEAAKLLGYDQEKWDNDTADGDIDEDEFSDAHESFDEEKKPPNDFSDEVTKKNADEEHSLPSLPSVHSLQKEIASLFGFGGSRTGESKPKDHVATESGETDIEPCEYDEDAHWRDLPDQVQIAAGVLGYTEEMWDKDKDPPSNDKSWKELSPREQRAAQILGYDQVKWDDDDSESSGSSDSS